MTSSIVEQIKAEGQKYIPQAESIGKLIRVAEKLKLQIAATRFRKTLEQMDKETFHIIVVGRFKNGKSTLLNALLGHLTVPVKELKNADGPLPMDDLPCTATLTSIYYSEKPYVKAWMLDEREEMWTMARYIKEAVVRPEAEETRQFFREIRQFELGYPAELCKEKVVLLDSPGTDDDPIRDEITKAALRECDAAIVVYRSDSPVSESEREFVQNMQREDGLARFFTVINLFHRRSVDDRLRRLIWDRLVTEMQQDGEKYNGQDFTKRDIHFIDCKQALDSVRSGNDKIKRESGFSLFEERLGSFIASDRYKVHLSRWIEMANTDAIELDGVARRQLDSLQMEQQEFQKVYNATLPKLLEIQDRRNQMSEIFKHYRSEAQRTTIASFKVRAAQIQNNLAEDLSKRLKPILEKKGLFERVWDRLKSPFIQKKIALEVSQLSNDIIMEQIKAWQDNRPPLPGIQQDLEPTLDHMFGEIKREVAAIDQYFQDIDFQLTGWKPENVSATLKGPALWERVIWGALGLLSLNSAIWGVTKGWKVAFPTLAVELGTAIAVVTLPVFATVVTAGLAPLIVIIAGVITAAMSGLWTADDTYKKLIEGTVRLIIEGDAEHNVKKLSEQVEATEPLLKAAVIGFFERIEEQITREVNIVIAAKDQEMRTMLENSVRTIDEKAKIIIEIQENLAVIAGCRQTLEDGLAMVQQMPPGQKIT